HKKISLGLSVMIAPTPDLHTLPQPSHTPTFLTCFHGSHIPPSSHAITGLHMYPHVILAHNNTPGHISVDTRENVLLLVTFVYFSINSIAVSHISLAFNSVFLGYIS